MTARDLGEDNIVLVAPDVERDAPIWLKWINGKDGKETLLDMGRSVEQTTLKDEQARVQAFIEGTDQINWMIKEDDDIVGTIWVDLKDKDYLKSPAVYVLIGDKKARKAGVGSEALDLVVTHLSRGRDIIYSRYLTDNKAASALLESRFFEPDGEPYKDKNGLTWQNVIRD